MDAPDRSAATRAHAHSAAVTPPTRSGAGRGLTAVRRAPSCAACPMRTRPVMDVARPEPRRFANRMDPENRQAIEAWLPIRRSLFGGLPGRAKLARRGLALASPLEASNARSAKWREGVSDGSRSAET